MRYEDLKVGQVVDVIGSQHTLRGVVIWVAPSGKPRLKNDIDWRRKVAPGIRKAVENLMSAPANGVLVRIDRTGSRGRALKPWYRVPQPSRLELVEYVECH